MRNALGVAIAAFFLGTVPASAQVRRVPVVRVTRLPSRVVAYGHVRQARPPVRFVNTGHPVVLSFPRRPVGSAPLSNPTVFPTATQTVTVEPSNAAFAPLGGTPIPLGQLLNPIPGLGFDFNHLAAINSGLAVRAFIDPVTEHELAVAESLPEQAPVGVSFFPTFGFDGAIPSAVAPSQPQVIVVQEPVPQPATAASALPPPVAKAAPPPLPVGELYLVRRDGSVIRAIAFSEQNGQIVYITKDGMRHSLPHGELNIQATQQRNAEHGTILHLSK